MDELAIIRAEPAGELLAVDRYEPVADQNFNRKKMMQLEHSMNTLQKSTRQHSEVVSALESGMKGMISEIDLRRAIGLAFQEFENRLEDAFQDSNRKCLTMFSRRDEVQDLQGQIGKKVNWSDHNAALKKLSDLRQYVDTMADSVFVGHREALNGEFSKKADRQMVEEALSRKAANDDVHELRARLERLEVLLSHTDLRQTSALETLREEAASKRRELAEQHLAMINQNAANIASLQAEHATIANRTTRAEAELVSITRSLAQAREQISALMKQQDEHVAPTLEAMHRQLDRLQTACNETTQGLRAAEIEAGGFRDSMQRSMGELGLQAKAGKEHVEFLLEEFEIMKRRSQERHKKVTSSVEDLITSQENLSQQLKSIERDVKRQGRDVRAIEHRTAKACGDDHSALAGLRALPAALSGAALPAPLPEAPDTNARLRAMLDQIEKIAGGGPPQEHFSVPYNPERPPLPLAGFMPKLPIAGTGIDGAGGAETARSLRLNAGDSVPIDSARGAVVLVHSGSARGACGLSPRMSPPRGGKVGKQRR